MVSRAPTLLEEERLWAQGYRLVAGIDEAGRGPLAGPVVAAAVVLPLGKPPTWLSLVRDSKVLTPQRREYLFDCMRCGGVLWGVGVVSHEVIDGKGIAAATRLAMREAVQAMSARPDFLLIDFMRLPNVHLPQKSVVDGDSLCLSIAAASVVAKVTRDRIMDRLDREYPGYGLGRHKGYATPEHLDMLQRLGPCAVHRMSFAPLNAMHRLL